MSLVFPSSSTAAWHFTRCEIYNLDFHKKSSYISYTPFQHRTVLRCTTENILPNIRNVPNSLRKYAVRCKGAHNESFTEERTISLDLDDEEDLEDTGLPWEGAVIYKRDSSISHLEYCTTLERLGLGRLSTGISKSRASVMGLRVTKAVKDYPHGTPVQISIDVTRKKKKLRLDGIIKTVISLGCNSQLLRAYSLNSASCLLMNWLLNQRLLTWVSYMGKTFIRMIKKMTRTRTMTH